MGNSGQQPPAQDSRDLPGSAAVSRPLTLSGENGQKADSRRCLADGAGCAETFDQAPLLAAHLVDVHLWKGSTAYLRARTTFLKDEAAPVVGIAAAGPPAPEPFDLAAHRRAQKPPRPHAPKEDGQPSAPKEESMPSKKGQRQPPYAERTCGSCGKKGHRSDHCPTSKAPDVATKPAACGYCHRADGHSKGCKKKGGCKICAKSASGKCGWHSGERGKPGPAPAARPSRGPIVTIHESFLSRIKAAIAEHERKAAALREALAILELVERPR